MVQVHPGNFIAAALRWRGSRTLANPAGDGRERPNVGSLARRSRVLARYLPAPAQAHVGLCLWP